MKELLGYDASLSMKSTKIFIFQTPDKQRNNKVDKIKSKKNENIWVTFDDNWELTDENNKQTVN
ncbi:MAG: hypothetical protein KAR19_11370 [Bacteroidales bacterium]|nr:hypothetical protein [Bacteroidales bacterium]